MENNDLLFLLQGQAGRLMVGDRPVGSVDIYRA